MRVEVSTTAYQFAHGKAPRGRGYWAFEFPGQSPANGPWFVPGEQTYSDAKRAAVAEANRRGVCFVKVAS
jgi:hypothetical protein